MQGRIVEAALERAALLLTTMTALQIKTRPPNVEQKPVGEIKLLG